jgi:ribulose-5-phosphate 4-epimerase/fuculose-1-phosphate aldolase
MAGSRGTFAGVGDEPRRRVAVACRILANAGLIEDVLGHVSVRVDADTVLVRARGPREAGVLFTEPGDVVACSLRSGAPLEATDHALPNELPIHLACYRAGSDVGAVVHAHPPAVIAADLAGVPLVPMVGAYNIPAARLAADGIAVFPRAVLINTDELGTAMVESMDGHPVCVLRGHGLTTVGATLEQAVARALAVDSLARMACRVAAAGGRPKAIADADLAQLPDLGSGFNDEMLWRHHERRLHHAGLALDAAGASS